MSESDSARSSLTAGWARRTITPPVGVDLTGYVGRPGASTAVHDDLSADALVVDDGSTSICLVTIDILGTDSEQDAALRAGISRTTGIRPENVLIGCSHTHGGPAAQRLRQCGTPDDSYLRWAYEQIKSAAGEAKSRQAPARLSISRASSDLGINRRHWVVERGLQADESSGTATDPEVWALAVDAEGIGRVVLFNYACHGVVMGSDNVEVTGDWITAAKSLLESDPSIETAMFLQGCCGDINPRLRGSFAEVQTAAELVARPLLAALADANPVVDPEIRVAWHRTDIPLSPLPPREEIEQEISFRRQEIERRRADGAPRVYVQIDEAMLGWAEDALEALDSGPLPGTVPLALQGVSFGEVTLLAIPGEVFSDIGLRIKRMRPTPVLVVGYANGNIGYIPTEAAFAEGGYETSEAFRYYGLRMIAPESEGVLLGAARSLLDKLIG